MAGFYPDAPSWRIAYDEDGTQGFKVTDTGVITDLTSADLIKLNNDVMGSDGPGAVSNVEAICLIFPCLMDIDAVFAVGDHFGGSNLRASAIKTSANTTNGFDGTWSSQSVGSAVGHTGKAAIRQDIVTSTWGGIRAVKFYGTGSFTQQFHTIHLYGEPTAGQTLDRLVLWHPTLNQRVGAAYFDWGDTPRASSADKTFRVKNISGTLTANAPRVSLETLDDGSPSVPGYHQVSKGAGFAAQQTLANIAPGGISAETITLRRTTPSNAQLGLWDLRIQAEASAGWS